MGETAFTLEVQTTDNISVDESVNESIEKSVRDMTDEEIIRYVSDENTNPTLEEIKYIINRGEGIIGGHDDNPELYELCNVYLMLFSKYMNMMCQKGTTLDHDFYAVVGDLHTHFLYDIVYQQQHKNLDPKYYLSDTSHEKEKRI